MQQILHDQAGVAMAGRGTKSLVKNDDSTRHGIGLGVEGLGTMDDGGKPHQWARRTSLSSTFASP
jgi:hypothetical protein